MTIAIYLFAGIFMLLSLALVFTWWRSRHHGALLLSLTYLCAAGTAVVMDEWWPLVIGFLSAWALRLMGMEPDGGASAKKPSRSLKE